MKKITEWFSRPDIKLGKCWWHRLVSILFIMGLFWSLVAVWDTPLPKYTVVAELNDRLTTQPQLLPELISSSEKIGIYENNLRGSWYRKNMGFVLKQPDVYCASNIAQHVEYISRKTEVTTFKGNLAYELISLDDFKEYVAGEDANCIHVTSIYIPDLGNNVDVISYAWFVGSELKVWQESSLATAVYIIKDSVMVLVFAVLLIVLYYRVFLYAVFGKRKK